MIARTLPLFVTLLALAPLCAAQAPAAHPSYAPPAADSAEVRAVRRLLDPRHRGGRATEDVVKELVAVGPRGATVLVAMLVGALPATDWEESGLTLEQAGADNAGDDQLLSAALRGLPPAPVARAVEDACAGDAPLERRLVGLHVLTEVGQGRESVACWKAIATGIAEVHLRRAYVRAQIETALAGSLARSAAGFEAFKGVAKTWERALLPTIVHACVQARRRQGVDVLFDLHGIDHELDLELLTALPELAADTLGGVDELRVGWVAGFLADPEASVRASAALGLGKLCDPGSAPRLVDALEDPDAAVVQAAVWALKRSSGAKLSADRAIWQSWLDEERRWWNEERPRSLDALAEPDPARVIAGLRELSQHPFYRHASAAAIAQVLGREEPELLCAACAALTQLGSLAAQEALTALLDRPDASVRAAARATLVSLTGQDLPEEAEAWQRLIGG